MGNALTFTFEEAKAVARKYDRIGNGGIMGLQCPFNIQPDCRTSHIVIIPSDNERHREYLDYLKDNNFNYEAAFYSGGWDKNSVYIYVVSGYAIRRAGETPEGTLLIDNTYLVSFYELGKMLDKLGRERPTLCGV